MTATSKPCTGCHQTLPLEDFQRDRKGKHGRVSRCRVCTSVRQGSKHIPRSNVEGLKICTACLRELPLEMFGQAKRGKHGRAADCKDCQRAYREQNTERSRQANRAYREANPEHMRAKDRAYYVNHAAAIKQRVAEYSKARPDIRRQASRNFRHNHPDRVRNNVINRRARKRQAEGRFTDADVQEKHVSQDGCCFWCSEVIEGKYHIDHVIPLARGGTNWSSNIVIACPECNWSKADKLPYSEWLPPKPLS